MTIEDRFAKMWKQSRHDAGKSQKYMAEALHVSRKTIENWENGYSCPDQMMGFRWFSVLGLQPLPYYLELLYPNTFTSDDDKIDFALMEIIKGIPVDTQRKLLYILYGHHGSVLPSFIELMVAYLQTPLELRLNIAETIMYNYKVADMHDATDKHIQPNMELINSSIRNCSDAVFNRHRCYSNIGKESD